MRACTVLALGLTLLGASGAHTAIAAAPDRAEAQAAKSNAAKPVEPHLVGHGGPVKTITADSVGMRLLTGSFDYSMILWQIGEDGAPQLQRRFDDHNAAVSATAFFADGQRAASASDDGTISLWDLETGSLIRRLSGHTAKILGLDISPGQNLLASASWDRTVRLWDVDTGNQIATLSSHKGPVNAVRFSRDGSRLVSAAHDGALNLWDVAKRQLIRPAYKHGWGINVLERLPTTGHYVFGALDGTTAVIDIEHGDLLHKVGQRDKPILALAHLAEPGLLAVGGGDGTIEIYRTGDWQRLEDYKNPFGPVWSMAFVDRGARLYFGSLDDHATAWQVSPRKPFEGPPPTSFPRRFQVGEDLSLGERQFARKCSICHTLTPDGRNRAGPTLYGVFGRRIAALPDYPFSESLKKLDIIWNERTIERLFEVGPHEFTPGSKMPLQQITDPAERKALVIFLKQATAANSNQQSEESR